VGRLAEVIASSWEPVDEVDEGPLKFAVDVSAWDRPDAATSPGLHFCHASCRCGNRNGTVPGRPYSVVVGLEWGASSWTAPVDARRIAVDEDATAVTVAQVAAVIDLLAGTGALRDRPAPVFAFDSGYDLTRIAYWSGSVQSSALSDFRW
jgi:DDE superfamily endonuclease